MHILLFFLILVGYTSAAGLELGVAEIPVIYQDFVDAAVKSLSSAHSHSENGNHFVANKFFSQALNQAIQSQDAELVSRVSKARMNGLMDTSKAELAKWDEMWKTPPTLSNMLPFLNWQIELKTQAEKANRVVSDALRAAKEAGDHVAVSKLTVMFGDSVFNLKSSRNPLPQLHQRLHAEKVNVPSKGIQ